MTVAGIVSQTFVERHVHFIGGLHLEFPWLPASQSITDSCFWDRALLTIGAADFCVCTAFMEPQKKVHQGVFV